MHKNTPQVHSAVVKQAAVDKLLSRGVTIESIAHIVYNLQIKYDPTLQFEACVDHVYAVLDKREMQHALLVAIEIDVLAEKGMLSEPLQSIVASDEGLFGCDETLAIGSTYTYGSIAVTTFGYLDKFKTGIIKDLDCSDGKVHTFLDDMVGSIAACAAARVAHRTRDRAEKDVEQ